MLPFMSKSKDASVAGLIIKNRNPDKEPESKPIEDDASAAIESCAQELVKAIHSRDAKAVAMALRDAFDILQSSPSEEDSNDFDSQNAKAAQEG